MRSNNGIKVEIGSNHSVFPRYIIAVSPRESIVLRTGSSIFPFGFSRQTETVFRIFLFQIAAIGINIIHGNF